MQTQHNQTQARRAELFQALAVFERDAQTNPETQARIRALRASLVQEETDECGPAKPKRAVVYTESESMAGHQGAEGLPPDHIRVGLLLRPSLLRAA
jgi:hypothetical protein